MSFPRSVMACLCCAMAAFAQSAADLAAQGDRLASEQRFHDAVELWTRALAVAPRYFPALYNLGFYYYSQGQFAQAKPLLERAVKAKPEGFEAHYVLGAAQSKTGDVDAAIQSWREALALQPGNTKLMQILTVEYSKNRYFVEAFKLAKELLNRQPNDLNIYLLAIKAAQDAGDYDSAADTAHRAVLAFPASARANFEYGFHRNLQGKTDDAIMYLKKAMEADPTYEEPFFVYGNLLVDRGQNAEAIPYLQIAIKDRNDFVPARVVLARALMNQKLWQEAITELTETVAIDPKHPQPHLLLSQIYFRLGDEARAGEEKQTSLRLRRENPTVLEAVQSRPFPAR